MELWRLDDRKSWPDSQAIMGIDRLSKTSSGCFLRWELDCTGEASLCGGEAELQADNKTFDQDKLSNQASNK